MSGVGVGWVCVVPIVGPPMYDKLIVDAFLHDVGFQGARVSAQKNTMIFRKSTVLTLLDSNFPGNPVLTLLDSNFPGL